MPETRNPILIAYDGSDPAKAAIQRAGELLAGQDAAVLVVWRAAEALLASATFLSYVPDLREFNNAEHEAAASLAREGAEIAAEAGLAAVPLTSRTNGLVADAIIEKAEERNASVIVVGSRGRSGAREAVLGSVSSHVMHHSHRPVLVIHTPYDTDLEPARVTGRSSVDEAAGAGSGSPATGRQAALR